MKRQYIEPQHTKEQFDKALALFNECGFEHITVDNEVDMVDCSWCPARSECTKFWDDYVVALPKNEKETATYLNDIKAKLVEFEEVKAEGRKAVNAFANFFSSVEKAKEKLEIKR